MIEAIAVDEIQASAGAQVSSASVPLLWMNRSGRVRPEFVEKGHPRPSRSHLVLSAAALLAWPGGLRASGCSAREVGGSFGIATVAAVFAGAGRLRHPRARSPTASPSATAACAGLARLGALAGLALAARCRPRDRATGCRVARLTRGGRARARGAVATRSPVARRIEEP